MKKIIFLAALILACSFSPQVFANQIVPGKQIEVMAANEIENILKNRGEYRRRELFFANGISDLNLPNGVIDIKIILPSNTLSYSGMTSGRARISINGKFYRDITFSVNLKIFDTVLIANHDLTIDLPVTANDFRIEEIPIDGRAEYIKNISEIRGLVPLRYVRAGSPVAKNYFQQPMAVKSQHPVKIIFRVNGLEVSAKGTALVSGRIGQVIRVKNDASQKILSARIIDSQTVEVIV